MNPLASIVAIVAIVAAGVIVYLAYKEQKTREKNAAFKADLMMKAARAKTEALNEEIYVNKFTGNILITNGWQFESELTEVGKKVKVLELQKFQQLLKQNYEKVGDL